VNDYSLAHLTL